MPRPKLLTEAQAREILRDRAPSSTITAAEAEFLLRARWRTTPRRCGWDAEGHLGGVVLRIDACDPPDGLFVLRHHVSERGREALHARWVDPPAGWWTRNPPPEPAPRWWETVTEAEEAAERAAAVARAFARVPDRAAAPQPPPPPCAPLAAPPLPPRDAPPMVQGSLF